MRREDRHPRTGHSGEGIRGAESSRNPRKECVLDVAAGKPSAFSGSMAALEAETCYGETMRLKLCVCFCLRDRLNILYAAL